MCENIPFKNCHPLLSYHRNLARPISSHRFGPSPSLPLPRICARDPNPGTPPSSARGHGFQRPLATPRGGWPDGQVPLGSSPPTPCANTRTPPRIFFHRLDGEDNGGSSTSRPSPPIFRSPTRRLRWPAPAPCPGLVSVSGSKVWLAVDLSAKVRWHWVAKAWSAATWLEMVRCLAARDWQMRSDL